MTSSADPEPDQAGSVLKVGQDSAGHWLVQDMWGSLEGRFVSQAAALGFARSESRALPGAKIVMATAPLVPIVSFAPVEPWERAQHDRIAA